MRWPHNNAPHRNALNFGKPDAFGASSAKHAKGTWQVFSGPDGWRAWRAFPANVDLGTYTNKGLAMSACARDCKEQP